MGFIEQVYNLCAHDIELRALIVRQNLLKVLSKTGVVPSEEFGKELKQEVLRYDQEICAEPFDIFEKISRNIGIRTALSLTEARERALAKVTTEMPPFSSVTNSTCGSAKESIPSHLPFLFSGRSRSDWPERHSKCGPDH